MNNADVMEELERQSAQEEPYARAVRDVFVQEFRCRHWFAKPREHVQFVATGAVALDAMRERYANESNQIRDMETIGREMALELGRIAVEIQERSKRLRGTEEDYQKTASIRRQQS